LKKGNALLIVLGFCICFLVGMFIGRSSVSQHIYGPFGDKLLPTQTTPVIGFPGNGTVDLNTANQQQLMMLPGIGEKLSQNILDYREQNGPFKQIQDVLLVEGITASVFLDIAVYLSVGGTYENSGC